MRDIHNWEMKSANLRGRVLKFDNFIPWDDYTDEIKLNLLKFFSKSRVSNVINGNSSLSSPELYKELNESLFSFNPSLWFCFAVDSSDFGNEMLIIQLKLLDLVEKCREIEISDLNSPTISSMSLKTLWALKDRSSSLHKTFRSFQDYFERFQKKETEIKDCRKYYTYFLSTLESLLYSSLKPFNAELDKLISINLDLMKNAITRNKIRSNYLYFSIKYLEFHPEIITIAFLEDLEKGDLESAIRILGDVTRIYASFFWAVEATIDDIFSELDYWTKIIPSNPEYDDIMLRNIFDEHTTEILHPSLLVIWQEIELCYKVGAFSACAILLRKLLENSIKRTWLEKFHSLEMLRDKNGNPKSLDKIIKKSETSGLLSKSLASEAQRIKFYGGIQAHDSWIPNVDQSAVMNGITTLKAIIQRLEFGEIEELEIKFNSMEE